MQQQQPFGTCWAFSLVAATEGVMVVQGNQKLQKLSEQFVVSGVPARNCGQGADVNWKWMVENTNGKIQVESAYPYNRTCNFFREQLLLLMESVMAIWKIVRCLAIHLTGPARHAQG